MKKLVAGLAVVSSLAIAPATAFAAGKHGGSTGASSQAGCTLSASGVGATLILNGTGFSPGASYGVAFVWPNGSGSDTAATADSSGDLYAQDWAYWSGSYSAMVSSGGKVVASCSTTVA